MEILIKDPGTKLFINDQAIWVQAEAEARVFLVPLDALKFCVEHEIRGMELTFRYSPAPVIRQRRFRREPGPQAS